MAKYPGWRTMTGAQRRNAKADRIWEEAKKRDPEIFGLTSTYLVTWQIEIDACSWAKAAEQAAIIQRDSESIATVFRVTNVATGRTEQVDVDFGYYSA